MVKPQIPRLARRLCVVASAAAILSIAAFVPGTAGAGAVGSQAAPPKPTIVLVHGAWADSSSWAPVIRLLQGDGYTVDAPPIPLDGLASDSQFLQSYLESIPGPIVLVGHSYGGAVITNAGTGNPNVKALVYVDAFAPARGETVAQLLFAKPGSCLTGDGDPNNVFTTAVNPALPAGDLDLYLRVAPDSAYPGFDACFANGVPAKDAAVLAAVQQPLAEGAVQEASGQPAWLSIPSWFLVGTQDQVIPPAELSFMAKRAGSKTVYVRAGHLSMIADPGATTRLILDAVRSTM